MTKFTELTMPFRHRIKEIIYRFKYLSFKDDTSEIKEEDRNAVISMVDGRMYHGGLNDRFKGIISGSLFAEYIGRPFRIKYNFPFQLTDFLVPNEYDWRIEDRNISNSIFHSRPLCTRHENLKRLLKVRSKGQIRLYCNKDVTTLFDFEPFNTDWGNQFNRLFKPSPLLQAEIDRNLKEIGGDYIAMVFRFQNLLGDFKEYKFKKITDNEYKDKLIEANLNEIRKVLDSDIFKSSSIRRILVTSDSATFLDATQKLPGVFSLRGKTAHIDTKGTGNTNHLKAFVDFFMISKAKKVYSVKIDNMYRSDFPNYAAKIGHVPFERIIKTLS